MTIWIKHYLISEYGLITAPHPSPHRQALTQYV